MWFDLVRNIQEKIAIVSYKEATFKKSMKIKWTMFSLLTKALGWIKFHTLQTNVLKAKEILADQFVIEYFPLWILQF